MKYIMWLETRPGVGTVERRLLLEQVHKLRQEGNSIRAIAAQLGVHPSRVQRALKSLDRRVTPLNQPSPPLRSGDGGFVGRRREMGELTSALDDAWSDQGGIVMLAGEPGIGKTRIAQELVAYAERQGAQALWGRCYEGEGTPPYWSWVQLLRSYVEQAKPERLRAEMGLGAAEITGILPELRDKLPDSPPPPSLEPEQARFRLFDAITTFLKNTARSQPLLLVLDDLHWADRPSLLLLEFIAGELMETRLLILGTYRDVEVARRHPLYQTLGDLLRAPKIP